ncbi:hypothetical protein MMC13_000574 [Lambiella insularis]|nr:hypothetical protein [Lambiella insularis]
MGWLWGSNKDGASGTSGNDPLKDLDPSLRAFLEKESPVKYKTAEAPPSTLTSRSLPPQLASEYAEASTQTSTQQATNSPAAKVPSESAYPDGRYAHIWSTYKRLSDIENATKSDQEKLLDVLNGFKERKAQIGRAALENCAEEQWAISECYRSGKVMDRLRLCHAENQCFERCYNMQARFLKALGYLSNYDRPPEVDEQIQMHADTLYHRMLDQERMVEEAKSAGLPIPTFPSLISPHRQSAVTPVKDHSGKDSSVEQPLPGDLEELKPKVKAQLRERLKGLSAEEREIEEKAMAMEIAAGEIVGKQITELYEETGNAKRLRKDQGKETFADRVGTWFGW